MLQAQSTLHHVSDVYQQPTGRPSRAPVVELLVDFGADVEGLNKVRFTNTDIHMDNVPQDENDIFIIRLLSFTATVGPTGSRDRMQ